jgi:hypothetical protein
MRSSFGHMGDAFEGIKEIYDSLPKTSKQRNMLMELAEKMAGMEGEWANLQGYWPDFYEHREMPFDCQWEENFFGS